MCLTAPTHAQTRIDSLEALLSKTTDPEKQLETLLEITNVYLDTDLDKALVTAERGIDISVTTELRALEEDFHLRLGVIHDMRGQCQQAHTYFDLAIEIYSSKQQIGQLDGYIERFLQDGTSIALHFPVTQTVTA